MRILHVIPAYLPAVRYGGPTVAVHGLCQALAGRGHDVEVFTTNVDGSQNSQVPTRIPVDVDGVRVRYFSCPFARRLFWAPALRWALLQEIGRYNVVHLHSVFLWPTWAAARAARRIHVPYVVSPRGMLIKDLIRRRSRIAKSTWIRFIEKSNLEHAAAIHLTSQLEAAELERFGWRLPPLSVIGNGVEEPSENAGFIAADVRAIVTDEPLVLYLGRISWKKGLDRLLLAFSNTRFGRLAIVGPDDEGLASQLEKQAISLSIADRVSFLPRSVVGPEKEFLFAAAQLFVLCSYSENFGNTVLEAMRRGVAVIVTPEVGAAEIVRASAAGMVVEGDPQMLGAAIERLIVDREFARSLGEAGQRHAQAHYAWPRVAEKMERLYEKISR